MGVIGEEKGKKKVFFLGNERRRRRRGPWKCYPSRPSFWLISIEFWLVLQKNFIFAMKQKIVCQNIAVTEEIIFSLGRF